MIPFITLQLEAYRDLNTTTKMEAYMKNKFNFFGVNGVNRNKIVNECWHLIKYKPNNEIALLIDDLMQCKEREYHQIACDISRKAIVKMDFKYFKNIETWIVTNSWWDTVDTLACNTAGPLILKTKQWDAVLPWIESDNIWLNRSAIILQLKFKENTNEELLSTAILANMHKKDFFIQKSIGWALRQYAKTNAPWILSFIEKHNINGLAKKEALRHLLKK